ncbi:glycosyltransferase family 4 protein [Rhodovastum atsumiense]|uniref:Glycosyltransferase family 4 protein n=1 Tax=Rhodovastum atsumiense TaxID=504468 RepID=A0A5M6ILJ2_9PROT|nr:glycosyltransferase family 4 protein [Rhodovastum atsumiense]KAA5608428.1 glycosyltransferase family 4 protein [Rhodovastum atsumiense]
MKGDAGAQGVPRSILLIVENCSVPFDRRVWQEACALRDVGYRVSVLSPRDPGQPRHEVLEGIEVYRHPALPEASGVAGYVLEYGAALFWETLFAWRIFLRTRFDAVHVSNPPDTLFLVAAPFKLLFDRRVVFDHHDVCPELYEAKFGRQGLGFRLLRLLERWSIRSADVVISTNDSYRRVAIDRGGKDPSSVFVVRNGPDLDRLRRVPPQPHLKAGRRYLVGYVGVIGIQEGLQYLVQGAAHLVHNLGRTDIQFAVIGSGSNQPAVVELAARLKVGEFFTFTGRIPDDALLAYLNTADVCVNPDEWNRMNDMSTMIKVMEYMALGKPIVQFDMTEGRVSAGESAFYARPNDAHDFALKIAGLLDDPERRERMGCLGRQRIEDDLAWMHQAPKLIAAYETLWRSLPAPRTEATEAPGGSMNAAAACRSPAGER